MQSTILLFICVLVTVNGQWVSHHGMTSQDYQAKFDKYTMQGYRLTWVSGYSHNGDVRFAAIWEKRSGGTWVARHGMTSNQYQSFFNQFTNQEYDLMHVSGYEVNGVDYYAAIFEHNGTPRSWIARHRLSSSDYQQFFDQQTKLGYRPRTLSGYAQNGQERIATVFEKDLPNRQWVTHHSLTAAQYQMSFDQYTSQNYIPTIGIGYNVGTAVKFIGLWEKIPGKAFVARHGLSSSAYQSQFDQWVGQGYKLNCISGYWENGEYKYAAVWTKNA